MVPVRLIMLTDNGFRKRIRHFNIAGHAHLLTFCCYKRLALLTNEEWCFTLSRAISRATDRHRCKLIAFVYMPEHVHLLVWPEKEGFKIEDLLYAIKKPFSSQIKLKLTLVDSPLLDELTVRERPGKEVFRFWQEGPGHDRNLISTEGCVQAADYIHNNPVRRGLCPTPDLYRWSSWRFYHEKNWLGDEALPRLDGFPG